MNKQIIVYEPNEQVKMEVKTDGETVWLTQDQMCRLFGRDQSVIARHIGNVFKEGELEKSMVVKDYLTTTRHGALEDKTQTHSVSYYNLDVIISVGYRVRSKRGTQFRIWANSVLRDYLIRGYAVKNNLVQEKYDELKALVDTMGRTMQCLETEAQEQIRSIFDVVRDYTYALDTLDGYDYQSLEIRNTSGAGTFHATYENAREVIDSLKSKFVVVNLINTKNTPV